MAETTGDVVIVCMDGSEHAKNALQFYTENIHKPNNKVVLVHCGQYVSFNYGNISVVSDSRSILEKMINEEEQRIKDLMSQMEEQMKKLGITNGEIERLHGDIGHEIVERARNTGADLIVTGARGMGTIRRTLLGSVSDYIVHHSTIPVLVCKDTGLQHQHDDKN